MKRQLVIAAALSVTLSLVAGPNAWAQGPGWGRGHGPGRWHGEKPGIGLAGLHLTIDQQRNIAALRTSMEKQVAEVQAQLNVKRAELHALWLSSSPERKAIERKHAEMDPLRAKLRAARIDFHLSLLKLLTKEQREQWALGRGGRGPGCGCGMGWGPGGGRGRGPRSW